MCYGDELASYLKQFPLVKQMTVPHMCVDENGVITNNGSHMIYAATHYIPKMSIPDTIEYLIKEYVDGHPEFLYLYMISHDKCLSSYDESMTGKVQARFAIHRPTSMSIRDEITRLNNEISEINSDAALKIKVIKEKIEKLRNSQVI